MNTSQLITYAPEARKSFIAAGSAQAAKLGVTTDGNAPADPQGDVVLVNGLAFPKAIDLDDGVKVNYAKFGDLLAEVKAV